MSYAQLALLDEVTALLEDVFECTTFIREDLQMVTDNVAFLATRTGDKNSAVIIAVFRDAMSLPITTGPAGYDYIV